MERPRPPQGARGRPKKAAAPAYSNTAQGRSHRSHDLERRAKKGNARDHLGRPPRAGPSSGRRCSALGDLLLGGAMVPRWGDSVRVLGAVGSAQFGNVRAIDSSGKIMVELESPGDGSKREGRKVWLLPSQVEVCCEKQNTAAVDEPQAVARLRKHFERQAKQTQVKKEREEAGNRPRCVLGRSQRSIDTGESLFSKETIQSADPLASGVKFQPRVRLVAQDQEEVVDQEEEVGPLGYIVSIRNRALHHLITVAPLRAAQKRLAFALVLMQYQPWHPAISRSVQMTRAAGSTDTCKARRGGGWVSRSHRGDHLEASRAPRRPIHLHELRAMKIDEASTAATPPARHRSRRGNAMISSVS